ncbi:MAG: TPM domain-containing protein [Thermostichus sp. DRC_bins_24]
MPKAWAAVLLGVVLLLPQPVLAITVEQVPNPRQSYGGWVSDTADILSSSTERELDRLITQLEQRTGAEMAVVTVPNTQGYATPKAFTTQLFNHWGIGKAAQNNGVLFLISVGDRRVEIETGTGLATTLPDAQVQQIIDRQILPKFRSGDFDGGTLAGVRQLISVLQGEAAATTGRVGRGSLGHLEGVDTSLAEGILLLLGIGGLGLGWQQSRRPVYATAKQRGERATPLKSIGSGAQTSRFGTQSTSIRLFLYSASILLGFWAVLVTRNLQVFVLPVMAIVATDGTLCLKHRIPFQPVCCERCRQPMQRIEPKAIHSYLSEPELVAHSHGRARYYGWLCPTCQGVALLVSEKALYRRHTCPQCQALTLDRRTEVIAEATYSYPGLWRETFTCPCCQYRSERDIEIPRLTYTESSSSSSSGSSSDFGGGSSSGGGAGGSW